MNDDIFTQLELLVERAVRPVQASFSRKRHMQEEILAHLMTVVEEEIEKHGDEQIALERAKQRFGNRQEFSTELQSSVPLFNRVRGYLEKMWCEPETFLLARQLSIQSGESGMSISTPSGPQRKSWKSVLVRDLKRVRVEAICLGIGLGLCLVWGFVTYEITALLRDVS
jgi:hypothetical protein